MATNPTDTSTGASAGRLSGAAGTSAGASGAAGRAGTDSTVVVLPSVAGLGRVADGELIRLQRQAGAARRAVDAVNAAIAGEIARRSDRALGHNGFAARLGASTPEAAIQTLTGVSLTDAKAMTAIGTALGADSPWLAPVLAGVTDGTLSIATAAAITTGLGSPSVTVAADDLLDAAVELVELAKDSTPESAAKSARTLRERLDVASIADLEAHRRSRRSLKWFEQADGTTRMVAVLDPESAAIITGALDTAMSPRRGGPRFIDTDQKARAADLAVDPRSNPQLAVDTLVEIVNIATRAATSTLDPATLFTDRSPAVRVHVQVESLRREGNASDAAESSTGTEAGAGVGLGGGVGAAYFEGQSALVSATTAERHICTSGLIPILFDGDIAIDVGATQRLHTSRQRIAIAAQWNGCAWTGCHRPPAMTEIHHLHPFNGRNTTLKNAVPLCRFHHMELHANRWQINRDHDDTYWLVPPQLSDAGRALTEQKQPGLKQPEPTQPVRLRINNPLSDLENLTSRVRSAV